MIEVRVAELADVPAGAALRPVASDFSPVNPAMIRFDRAAGAAVAAQCASLGDIPVGSAVITPGGELDAEYIVHVAVRSTDENVSRAAVQRGLLNGLRRLEQWGIESVAVAPLGVGAGNLDAEESADAMLPVLVEHMRGSRHPSTIILAVEDAYQRDAFAAAVARHAGKLSGKRA